MVSIRPGRVTVGGVALGNHLLLAAGILGTTGASLSRMLTLGAGGVVTKSIGPVPKDGHAGPCLVVLEDGLLNAMGLPNPSKEFVDELTPLAKKPVVASIFGGTPEEFATVAGWFAGKVAGFELNLSCPHAEGYGAAIGSDPALVEACTRAVSKSGVPTWVKLTPNVTDITADREGGGTRRGECHRCDQHGEGDADLHCPAAPGAGQPVRRLVRECGLPGRGPLRVRTLRCREDPDHRVRRDRECR